MDITIKDAANLLNRQQKVVILSHRAPDGDTLGCAAALGTALSRMGKQVRFACSDEVPEKFACLFSELPPIHHPPAPQPFPDEFVVSVDIAADNLFGDALAAYPARVNLCIDHHVSGSDFAECRVLDAAAAATGEIVYTLLLEMGAEIDPKIADCLYIAVSTDTGCFKFPNTTSRTLRIAADLIDLGAHSPDINRRLFDTLSPARIALERLAFDRLESHFDGRCIVMDLPRALLEQTGAKGSDLDGIAGLPRQIEGALVGITIRERKDGGYKLSLRGQSPINCAEICERFGGGGHAGAAGCAFEGISLAEVKRQILAAVQHSLKAD